MKYLITIIPALLIVVLSGCNIFKPYTRPEGLPVDSLYNDSTMVHADTLASLGHIPWEELFTDPYLQALIREGLQSNTDLQIAMLRIDEAEANLKSARLAFLPSVTLGADANFSTVNFRNPGLTADIPVAVSWEADLFGKLKNAREEAQAELLAQSAYARAVRSELIASIASSYYSLLMIDRQMAISDSTIGIWNEQVRTLEVQKRYGDVRDNAVSQAKANLNQLHATHNTLMRQQHEAENALCTLLGVTARHIDRSTLESQALPADINVGVPLQLLSDRPDVVQAEMTLAAACYGVNVSRAAFYPTVTLGGSLGWITSVGQAVSNPAGFLLSALASVVQPLFQRGQLRTNLRISEDEQQIALLNYRQALLNAGQEVNDALYAIGSHTANLDYHTAQCADLQNTVRANEALFRTGNATYLELLSSRQDLLNSRLNIVADHFNRLQSIVTLYRSLGGGA